MEVREVAWTVAVAAVVEADVEAGMDADILSSMS